MISTSWVLLAAGSLLSSATSTFASPSRRADCDVYTVDGQSGGFTNRVFADFSSAQSGGDVAQALSQYGLFRSDYGPLVDSETGIGHTFTPDNVFLGDGSLEMKVSAYSNDQNVLSSEIQTTESFKYGSVRVVQKSSGVPGVCEGNFFYLDDTHEVDWEILTTTTLQGSGSVDAGIWATNQAPSGAEKTHELVPFTFDPSQDFHEYRIDWFEDATVFYIDGEQKARITENVPTVDTYYIFNAWSSGNKFWSAGPPTADSITHIRSIDLYTGYDASASSSSACLI